MNTRATPAAPTTARPRATTGKVRPFRLAPTVSLDALLDEAGGDTRFRQLLYDISIASAHLESARRFLAGRLGVSSPQYNMAMVMARNEEPAGISVNDVAAKLNISSTFVTTEIKKLVRAGLVTKTVNPADARGVLLRLSPEGESRVKALEPDLLRVNDRMFAELSQEDFLHLSRIVQPLIEGFARTVRELRDLPVRGGAA